MSQRRIFFVGFISGVLFSLYYIKVLGPTLPKNGMIPYTSSWKNRTGHYHEKRKKLSTSNDISTNFRDLLRSRYNIFPTGLGEDNRRNGHKYFIYRCDKNGCGGWGDRLKGIMTSYVIANLTGRSFKVEINSHNCDILNYIVPNLVNWSLPVSFHEQNTRDPNVYTMNKINDKIFHDTLSKINFNTLPEMKADFVYFRCNQDQSDGFKASIPHSTPLAWMRNLTIEQIVGVLFRRLIKPSPSLQDRLDDFLKGALPDSKDKLICAHIRMGKNPTMPHDTRIGPKVKELSRIWAFLNRHSLRQNHKLFLMSDSKEVIAEAKRQPFGDKLLLSPGKDIIHIENTRGVKDEKMCEGLGKVVLEHFILMHCDVLLLTRSGLSRIAAYARGSDTGVYCLVRGEIIPCPLHVLKRYFGVFW